MQTKEMFAFCVITFAPVTIQTHSALQNDRLILSFVKDMNVVGKKMARNGRKTAIYQSHIMVNSLQRAKDGREEQENIY